MSTSYVAIGLEDGGYWKGYRDCHTTTSDNSTIVWCYETLKRRCQCAEIVAIDDWDKQFDLATRSLVLPDGRRVWFGDVPDSAFVPITGKPCEHGKRRGNRGD